MLKYRKLSGYKYTVADEYRAGVPELLGVEANQPWFRITGGEMIVRDGYAWDGASGPTIDTVATLEASLVHDVGYQAIRIGAMLADRRADCDAVLYRLLRRGQHKWAASRSTSLGRALAGMWIETRALYYFAAVRAFGRGSIKPTSVENQDRVFTT